ncbi:hypothetical protein IEO21_00396 [Rhodonia placenta]|uniref:Uncharacterized protein n=1 Tax=Rhodonia placenta TaxID=104341 RepID=A0A8H7U6D7_9APHY|nr:hypothetical protein IEO21_00396 [Postia placenta]
MRLRMMMSWISMRKAMRKSMMRNSLPVQ